MNETGSARVTPLISGVRMFGPIYEMLDIVVSWSTEKAIDS